MKVKILDVDLIRRYGNSIIDMNDMLAFSLQKQNKVKIIDTLPEKELPDSGTVLIFANGNKEKEIDKNKRIPDVDEPLFPQINM